MSISLCVNSNIVPITTKEWMTERMNKQTNRTKEANGLEREKAHEEQEQQCAEKGNECYLYVHFFHYSNDPNPLKYLHLHHRIQMVKKRAVNCWRHFWKETKKGTTFSPLLCFDGAAALLFETVLAEIFFCCFVFCNSNSSLAVNRTLILQIAPNILGKLFSTFCVCVCVRANKKKEHEEQEALVILPDFGTIKFILVPCFSVV